MFKLTVSGEKEAIKRLSILATKAQNLRPALSNIGEYMQLQTRKRFDTSTAPNGKPWAPLQASTIRAKEISKNRKQKRGVRRLYKRTRANPADILKDTFLLRDTITYQIEGDQVAIGTPQKYGVMHQLGTKKMVKRPFLGVSAADRQEIQQILKDHLDI